MIELLNIKKKKKTIISLLANKAFEPDIKMEPGKVNAKKNGRQPGFWYLEEHDPKRISQPVTSD